MRILVTGVNNGQCVPDYYKSTRSKAALVTATTALVNALKHMGHEVDQRYVIPGEDLSMYDKAFVYAMDFTRGMSKGGYGMLWALHEHKDAVICIDDWVAPKALYKLHSKTYTDEDMEELLFRDFLLDQVSDAAKVAVKEKRVRDGIKSAFNQNIFDNYKFLYCAFDNFNIEKLLDYKHNAYSFNPEPFVPTPQSRIDDGGLGTNIFDLFGTEQKKRQWVIAGLAGLPLKKACSDLSDTFKWKVELYGNVPDELKLQSRMAKEYEVINAYKNSRAVYYPDQGNFGANWWRNRPRQCADMGAVLYIPSDDEAKLFGESYRNLTIELIESMTDEQLDELAANQKRDYYQSNPLNKQTVIDCLNLLLA